MYKIITQVITIEYPDYADIFLLEKDHLIEQTEKKSLNRINDILKQEKGIELDGFGFSADQIPEYITAFISLITFYRQYRNDKKSKKLKDNKQTLLNTLRKSGVSEKKAESLVKKFFDELEED